MLKARLLRKSLGDTLVLNELNMDVEDGCIYGLIGPNGAGKSTLLRVIAGIYRPDLGVITVDDQKIYDDPCKKEDILLINDDPYYFFNATLKDMKNFYKISYPDMDEELYQSLLKTFHLDEKKPLHTFSKGMKRQSFLILGMAIAPRYLLLDEAFDGLDPRMRLLFKRLISKRIEEKQMTVIISSHNLKEMEDICDSFGMLEGGRLVTSGSMSDCLDEVHKIQIAFADEKQKEDFAMLDTMSIRIDSRVVNLVVRGDIADIHPILKAMHPIMMEVLPVSLEEIFLYEMQRREEYRS